jgi:hypothetical protein
MKTIPLLHRHAVYDVLMFFMTVAAIMLIWSILSAVHVYPSTCTIVSYKESPYSIPVSDKPWEGTTPMARIKVCIFEGVYARDTACGVVHDGAADPQFKEYYALGTQLRCKTAPWSLYTRILGAYVGNGASLWKHKNPDLTNVFLWAFIPVTLVSLMACYAGIEHEKRHRSPENAAEMMREFDMATMILLVVFFAMYATLSLLMIAVMSERTCEVTHSWIRPAPLGDDMIMCLKTVKQHDVKSEHGCVSVPYGQTWDDALVALDRYAPGTRVTCTVHKLLPMNRIFAVMLTNVSDYTNEVCSGGTTWLETIRAVPSATRVWAFSFGVCALLATAIVVWLTAPSDTENAKKIQIE